MFLSIHLLQKLGYSRNKEPIYLELVPSSWLPILESIIYNTNTILVLVGDYCTAPPVMQLECSVRGTWYDIVIDPGSVIILARAFAIHPHVP